MIPVAVAVDVAAAASAALSFALYENLVLYALEPHLQPSPPPPLALLLALHPGLALPSGWQPLDLSKRMYLVLFTPIQQLSIP